MPASARCLTVVVPPWWASVPFTSPSLHVTSVGILPDLSVDKMKGDLERYALWALNSPPRPPRACPSPLYFLSLDTVYTTRQCQAHPWAVLPCPYVCKLPLVFLVVLSSCLWSCAELEADLRTPKLLRTLSAVSRACFPFSGLMDPFHMHRHWGPGSLRNSEFFKILKSSTWGSFGSCDLWTVLPPPSSLSPHTYWISIC